VSKEDVKKLLERNEFVNALLEKMRLETQYSPPIYDEETLTINWNGYQFFLGNIYEDYSRLTTKEAAKSLETAVVISIDTESSIVIPKENWFEENDLDFDKAFNSIDCKPRFL
jgi:hypothetical protein